MSRTALRKFKDVFVLNKVQFMKKKFSVYLLIKDKKPIYVGCSVDIEKRIIKHKLTKDFDNYYILKQYDNKKEAYCAENAIIRFISVFGGNEWLNGKHITLVYDGNIRGLNNVFEIIC